MKYKRAVDYVSEILLFMYIVSNLLLDSNNYNHTKEYTSDVLILNFLVIFVSAFSMDMTSKYYVLVMFLASSSVGYSLFKDMSYLS